LTILIPALGGEVRRGTGRRRTRVLRLITGRHYKTYYVFSAMLNAGWRIVALTPEERALLEVHGMGSGWLQ